MRALFCIMTRFTIFCFVLSHLFLLTNCEVKEKDSLATLHQQQKIAKKVMQVKNSEQIFFYFAATNEYKPNSFKRLNFLYSSNFTMAVFMRLFAVQLEFFSLN